MDNEHWRNEDKIRIDAMNWVSKVKSAEVIAEQVFNYLFPNGTHKQLMQVLMFFEMAKVFFRLKAYFSADEALLMEEKIFQFLMADNRRKEMLRKRMENVFGLLQFYSRSKSETNDDVLSRIHHVLGMKKKEIETKEVQGDEEKRNDQIMELEPASSNARKKEYVEDKESMVLSA